MEEDNSLPLGPKENQWKKHLLLTSRTRFWNRSLNAKPQFRHRFLRYPASKAVSRSVTLKRAMEVISSNSECKAEKVPRIEKRSPLRTSRNKRPILRSSLASKFLPKRKCL